MEPYTLSGTTVIFAVGEKQYLVHPERLARVNPSDGLEDGAVSPVMVLEAKDVTASEGNRTATIQQLIVHDDVCSPGFARTLVVKSNRFPHNQVFTLGLVGLPSTRAENRTTHKILCLHEANPTTYRVLPPGPYFLKGRSIHRAFRLHPDEQGAFIHGMIRRYAYNNSVMCQATPSLGGANKYIPVPSRHYYEKKSAAKPLSGDRIAVNDNFTMAGVISTLSSRAYIEHYKDEPPRTENATVVDNLIALGAVIVGKTKTTSFSTGRDLGSSTGAAAALAAYDWLDYAIGADSVLARASLFFSANRGQVSGSGTESVTCHGLFGLRPSQLGERDTVSLERIALSSKYDTIVCMARHLDSLDTMAAHILHKPSLVWPDLDLRNASLIYPVDLLDGLSDHHRNLMDEFVRTFETLLGVQRTEIEIARLWRDPQGAGLQRYLAEAYSSSLAYEEWHTYKNFFNGYKSNHSCGPFLEDLTKARWTMGASMSEDDYQGHQQRLNRFRHWFYQPTVIKGIGNAIFILPHGTAVPRYRHERPDMNPGDMESFRAEMLSPILGTPQVLVPFAQVPYMSKVTGVKELLPLSAIVMGRKGSDRTLVDLVRRVCRVVDWPTEVMTGKQPFVTESGNIRNACNPIKAD